MKGASVIRGPNWTIFSPCPMFDSGVGRNAVPVCGMGGGMVGSLGLQPPCDKRASGAEMSIAVAAFETRLGHVKRTGRTLAPVDGSAAFADTAIRTGTKRDFAGSGHECAVW